ncbi:unnamed protein product, partial [Brassica rapa subsp. trilocularis]
TASTTVRPKKPHLRSPDQISPPTQPQCPKSHGEPQSDHHRMDHCSSSSPYKAN